MYTIHKNFPKMENLNILFVGDIKHSRTIHSLVELFASYPRNKLFFLPYRHCYPDSDYLFTVGGRHLQMTDNMIINKIDLDISDYDVVYMTRMQKERHETPVSPDFILTPEIADQMKKESLIMHPFPRNEELPSSVDSNERAVYFDQMRYGVYIRMALLEDLV